MANNISLSESINEVKNMKGSMNAKVNALIKLGLRKTESQMLVDMWNKDIVRTPRTRAFKYTFGVEIECNVDFNGVINGDRDMFYYAGYTHETVKKYKFVTDASVGGDNPIECVSPVLDGNKSGMDSLKKCCDALAANGARVNSSCGLHVHIGASSLSEEAYANVFVNYMRLERLIDTFMANSRRANNSTWCKSIIGKGLERAHSRRDVLACFGEGLDSHSRSGSRYHKVNPMAWLGHKTLEFRQHAGTTNYEKISNWVKFLGALVEYSKNNRLDHEVTSIEDVPFLTNELKSYFKGRIEHFATR